MPYSIDFLLVQAPIYERARATALARVYGRARYLPYDPESTYTILTCSLPVCKEEDVSFFFSNSSRSMTHRAL